MNETGPELLSLRVVARERGCILQLTCQHRISFRRPKGQKHWGAPFSAAKENLKSEAKLQAERDTYHDKDCSYTQCLQL